MSNGVLPECSAEFARNKQWQEDKGEKIDAVFSAVVGINGDMKDSMASRLAVLETTKKNEQASNDKTWKGVAVVATCVAAVSSIGSIILAIILKGGTP